MKKPQPHRYAVIKNRAGRWVVLRHGDLKLMGTFISHAVAINYAQTCPTIGASL